jgi:Virulence factor
MAKFQVLYWHDMPLQVRAGNRRNRARIELAPRFKAVVDQLAMADGLTGTGEYLDGFHWSELQERGRSTEEAAAAVAAELETSYSQIDWLETAKVILVKDSGQETG